MKHQQGFTLIEVLLIVPIAIVAIVGIMSYLFGQFGQLTEQGAQINLQATTQNIIFSMQDDVFFANAFVSTMNTNLVDNYQPAGGWTNNSIPPTLLISTPAFTTNRRSVSRQPVYINTYGCSAGVIQNNSVLYDNVIYFAQGTNLYKRHTTVPSSTSLCGTDYTKQSCPQASATSSCPADVLLTDKFSSIAYTYYDANNNVVTVPEQATKIKIDLSLTDTAFGDTIKGSSSITIKKLNQL
ncbi:MAG: hypothetical protein NVSMB46_02780 [Candidatus Saccharimonadales bacterium]